MPSARRLRQTLGAAECSSRGERRHGRSERWHCNECLRGSGRVLWSEHFSAKATNGGDSHAKVTHSVQREISVWCLFSQTLFSASCVVHVATPLRRNPCASSQSSRKLPPMQTRVRIFSPHTARRTQPSSVQCYSGPQQHPAPNPSFKRTCLRQAA